MGVGDFSNLLLKEIKSPPQSFFNYILERERERKDVNNNQ